MSSPTPPTDRNAVRRRRTAALTALAALALGACGTPPTAAPDTAALDAAPPEPPAVTEPSEETGPARKRPKQGCHKPGRSDINGDGHADAVVGDYAGGSQEGGVRVLYGTRTGLSTGGAGAPDDQVVTPRTPGVPTAPSPQLSDEWGKALAVADFDGDGCADVAVGAPGEALPDAPAVGAVHVLYGAPEGLRTQGADTIAQGGLAPGVPQREDGFAHALAAGDFDGDGITDLAVSAPGDGPKPTYASGGVEGNADPAARPTCPPQVGCLWVEHPPSDHGSVTVVYGSRDGLGKGRPARSFPAADFARPEGVFVNVGAALAAGDFDGNGADDLVVTVTPRGEKEGFFGAVHILPGARGSGLGRAEPQRYDRDTAGVPGKAVAEAFGDALAAGDLDGNGTDDLAIGAWHVGTITRNAGKVVVLYSRDGGGLTGEGAQEWRATSPGLPRPTGAAEFGRTLAIGRFGGNGPAEDLAVAAPLSLGGHRNPNSVTVLLGGGGGLRAAGSVLLTPTVHGDSDAFGAALAGLPVRGGRYDDLIVTAPGAGGAGGAGGALDAYRTGPAGPVAEDARRFRPEDPGMTRDSAHRVGFGYAIG